MSLLVRRVSIFNRGCTSVLSSRVVSAPASHSTTPKLCTLGSRLSATNRSMSAESKHAAGGKLHAGRVSYPTLNRNNATLMALMEAASKNQHCNAPSAHPGHVHVLDSSSTPFHCPCRIHQACSCRCGAAQPYHLAEPHYVKSHLAASAHSEAVASGLAVASAAAATGTCVRCDDATRVTTSTLLQASWMPQLQQLQWSQRGPLSTPLSHNQRGQKQRWALHKAWRPCKRHDKAPTTPSTAPLSVRVSRSQFAQPTVLVPGEKVKVPGHSMACDKRQASSVTDQGGLGPWCHPQLLG